MEDVQPTTEEHPTFPNLLKVVNTLRGEHGCPWDIKQTPASLKKYLFEECQELLDAIDQEDQPSICEEIGDVLFLLAFLISIYEDRSQFTSEDVLSGIIAKMIRRHPHVFAGLQVSDEQSLRDQWNRIKEEEKSQFKSQD